MKINKLTFENMKKKREHNNRKQTDCRRIQVIKLKDELGNYTGKTKTIHHETNARIERRKIFASKVTGHNLM